MTRNIIKIWLLGPVSGSHAPKSEKNMKILWNRYDQEYEHNITFGLRIWVPSPKCGKNGKITPIYKIFWENHTDLQKFLGKSCFEKGKVKILFVKWRFLFQNWRFQVEKWRFQLESEDLKGRNTDLKARSEDLTLKMKIYIGFSHIIL